MEDSEFAPGRQTRGREYQESEEAAANALCTVSGPMSGSSLFLEQAMGDLVVRAVVATVIMKGVENVKRLVTGWPLALTAGLYAKAFVLHNGSTIRQ